jgi:hypothetical protein
MIESGFARALVWAEDEGLLHETHSCISGGSFQMFEKEYESKR